MATTASPLQALPTRLGQLRDALLAGLVERDVAVRLSLLAALSGEHLLLIGPPGTAKSQIAQRLRFAFSDGLFFQKLLTRFSVPEELFGPLSIKGLEEDRYERLTEFYLPAASIAFLDEIFKANSAILNSLLTLLNERQFDNGTRRMETPLIAVIGASNELPEKDELHALYDRFLLRLYVSPVSDNGFKPLLRLHGNLEPNVRPEAKLTRDDLHRVQAEADKVELPPDIEHLLQELRTWCVAEKIQVSDRRWRKIVKLLQVSALTNGRRQVSVWDCWLLQHCLWEKPEHASKVGEWYASRVGASAAVNPGKLTKVLVSLEARLKADQHGRQKRDKDGAPLFKRPDGKPTTQRYRQATRDGQPLYLAPSTATSRGPMPLAPMMSGPAQAGARGGSVDRTNRGAGYTIAELDNLWIDQGMVPAQYAHLSHFSSPPFASQFSDWPGRDTYLADEKNWLMDKTELPPLLEPPRPHERDYVAQCARDVTDLRKDLVRYREQLGSHRQSLEREISTHLWVAPGFLDTAARHLNRSMQEVEDLLQRTQRLCNGVLHLPVEPVSLVDLLEPALKELLRNLEGKATA